MSAYTHLLAPGRIGSVEIRNRIVMAPMGSNLCERDGRPGDRMKAYYEERARGGVGLVIVELAGVAWPAGASNPWQLAISSDEFVPDLADLVARVHRHGARAAIQLHHGGKVATRDIASGRAMWVPSIPPQDPMDLFRDLGPDDRDAAIGDYTKPGAAVEYHVMTRDDIAHATQWFADAAARARAAGFDAVELHAGHGYLIQEFLSPHTNRRDDEYGGPVDARARFLVETVGAVRDRVGDALAVWCRLDGCEIGIEDGITVADAQLTAALAAEAGLDAIHVSAYANPGVGARFTEAPLVHEPGGFLALAEGIRARAGVPVIAVGRIEPDAAEQLLSRQRVDFVAMGRKLLADPHLPRKLAAGHAGEIRPCIYSYRCVGNVFLNRRAACTVNPSTGREHETSPAYEPATDPRHVVVVGGGPAGMEVTRIAASRGHRVTLLERSTRLGGLALHAARVEPAIAPLVAWLESQLAGLDVDVRLGVDAEVATVTELAPDAVVLAIGAAWDATDGAATTPPELDSVLRAEHDGRSVTVLGGGSMGLELAEYFHDRGARVTVVEPGPVLGSPMAPPRLWRTLNHLRSAGVVFDRNAPSEVRAAADLTISTLGASSRPALAMQLRAGGFEVHEVGDCTGLGYLEGAFRDADRVGRAL